MDAKQLKDDVQAGRIGVDRLVDLIEALQRQLRETQRQLDEAKRRIAELEKKLGPQATTRIEGAFSVRAEEKRQEARGKVKRKQNRPTRRGRVTTAEKVRRAERTEKCPAHAIGSALGRRVRAALHVAGEFGSGAC